VLQRPLVSILIPAYNCPDYTRKTLQSIVEQEYRPVELVFSDDCSPTPLEPLVEEFRRFESDEFCIRFFRQPTNIHGDNIIFGFDQCTGKYVVQMPHDDWWTDKRFLVEAVELMEENPGCYLCVANSEIEHTDGKTMIKLPQKLAAKDQWRILDGATYINLLGEQRMGVQAWSGIVCNLPVARSLGMLHYPYNLDHGLARGLGVFGDDGFSFQFLLSSIGSVAVTEKVVSVRGRPETAFSSATSGFRWDKVMGQALFIIYYNLYKSDLSGKYAQAVKKRAKDMIFEYPVEKINMRILRHYHYAPDAIWLMGVSYLLHLLRWPMYFVNLVQRLRYRLANEDPVQVWHDLQLKFKKRGLFRSLFPSRL
jgi:glycosyltransferase involved in cell wall biosynthesis